MTPENCGFRTQGDLFYRLVRPNTHKHMNTIARTFSLLTLLIAVTTSTAQEKTSQKSKNENKTPNAIYGVGLKDFAEVKEPFPSDDTKSGIIVRSFKKIATVTVYTGEFALSQGGFSPVKGEFKPSAGMTFVRIIFDISFESVPTVLWKDKIELVVDGEKPVTPFEFVQDTGKPIVSAYGLDGLDFKKRHNRLAVTLEVKDTDPEKMVFRVNGKSYGTLKSLFPTPKRWWQFWK